MLEIENLETNFNTYDGVVKALNGVNLTIKDGEIFGLVGETGSGKSTTIDIISGLLRFQKGTFEIGPNQACLKETAKFISSLE